MVRKFELDGVYQCKLTVKGTQHLVGCLIQVTGFDKTRRHQPWDRIQYRVFGSYKQAMKLLGVTPSYVLTSQCKVNKYDDNAETVDMYFPQAELDLYHIYISSKRVILKTVLMFCALKLIVLARRTKERMYAPGGSGFVMASENFERATKRQCL